MSKNILYERAENMRYNPTKAERIFRDLLEFKNINYKSQVVMGRYIADFVIGKIVIELDGSSHIGREVEDEIRDCFMRSKGYRVIRILNKDAGNFDVTRLKNNKEPREKTKSNWREEMKPEKLAKMPVKGKEKVYDSSRKAFLKKQARLNNPKWID